MYNLIDIPKYIIQNDKMSDMERESYLHWFKYSTQHRIFELVNFVKDFYKNHSIEVGFTHVDLIILEICLKNVISDRLISNDEMFALRRLSNIDMKSSMPFRTFSVLTLSLLFDTAMYLSQYFIANLNDIKITIKKGKSNEFNNNAITLTGFNNEEINIINAVIVIFYKLMEVRTDHSQCILLEFFETWKNIASHGGMKLINDIMTQLK